MWLHSLGRTAAAQCGLFTYKSVPVIFEPPCIILCHYFMGFINKIGARGGVVVKALRYKQAGRGFDSRWCHWNFSVTYSFQSHYGPGIDSSSNRNEYQVHFLAVKAAGA